jgi:hypothetical protein
MRSHRMVLGALGFALLVGSTAAAKATATVTYTDGTTSKAGRGACSHHGGVASAGTAASAPASKGGAPKAQAAAAANAGDVAGATAKCKDGTYSHSTHNGACSHHGGVAQWLDGSGQ